MREIKFRAWDKFDKQWRNDFIKLTDGVLEICHPNMDVMQSTGLKDKSGREIYEGDIIKDMGLAVRQVFWNEETARFETDRNWLGVDSNCEIIGNIYENHELMTP